MQIKELPNPVWCSQPFSIGSQRLLSDAAAAEDSSAAVKLSDAAIKVCFSCPERVIDHQAAPHTSISIAPAFRLQDVHELKPEWLLFATMLCLLFGNRISPWSEQRCAVCRGYSMCWHMRQRRMKRRCT